MHHLYHIPAKIFLLGEYSVLAGEPALVAAIRLNAGESFYGFGSSTARYILESSKAEGAKESTQLWKEYRSENPHASGADLIAQSEALKGKGSVFTVQLNGRESISVEPVAPLPNFSTIHIFSAAEAMSRKLNTDHHLKTLSDKMNYPKSAAYVQKFLNAKTAADFSILTDWADEFNLLQLETKAAKLDRDFIQSLKGVTGVKGCGAGLNDVFLVAIDDALVPSVSNLTSLISQERNLSYQGTLLQRLWSNE